MRYELHFSDEGTELVIRLSGPARFEVVEAYLSELHGDPRMVTCQRVLVDCIELDPRSLGEDELQTLGEYQRRRSPGQQKVALVMGQPLGFGLARQFGVFAEGPEQPDRRVFRDLESAWAWLRS